MSGTVQQRSEEHTSELQSHSDLVCRLLLEQKKHPVLILVDRVSIRITEQQVSAVFVYPNRSFCKLLFFFFNDTATTEIYTLSLHDALPISRRSGPANMVARQVPPGRTSI